MSEKVTRRNFFKLLGGGVALAAMPSIALAEKVINIPVEFGWTWFVDKNKAPVSLMSLIKETLSQNTQKIAENVSQNNSLLLKLKDGTKVNLQIEQISKEAQNKRIIERMIDREAKRIADIEKNYNLQDYLDGKIPHPLYRTYIDGKSPKKILS